MNCFLPPSSEITIKYNLSFNGRKIYPILLVSCIQVCYYQDNSRAPEG